MITATTSKIKEQWPYLLFLITLGALLVYLYTLTWTYRNPETGLLPRLVIGFTLIIILLDILLRVFPQFVPSTIRSDSSTDSGFEQRNIHPLAVVKQFGWVLMYLAGMFYVGFFTTTFLFALLYIYINGPESSRSRRLGIAVVWGLGINAFLWLLFVELLQVSSVFQLGAFL